MFPRSGDTSYIFIHWIWTNLWIVDSSFHGKPADIWAGGVTLFYFLTARLPFLAANALALKEKITKLEPEYPSNLSPLVVDFMKLCLAKDPNQRATITALMTHPWITNNRRDPLFQQFEGCFEITEVDLRNAFSSVTLRATILLTMNMKRRLRKIRTQIQDKLKMPHND